MRSLVLASAVPLIALCSDASAADVHVDDEFTGMNWDNWCDCRMSPDLAKRQYLSENGTSFVRITVDDGDLGGNKCSTAEVTACESKMSRPATFAVDTGLVAFLNLPEPLGAPLDRPGLAASWLGEVAAYVGLDIPGLKTAIPATPEGGYYCDQATKDRGLLKGQETSPCVQRQEFQTEHSIWRSYDEPFLYSLIFRTRDYIQDQDHSVRWILAQWKQTDTVHGKYSDDLSPYLALRFDDGVLRVTVQDEECRCVIASASTDDTIDASSGKPSNCVPTGKGHSDGDQCAAPPSLKLLHFGAAPTLPAGRSDWTTLRFRVQAGLGGKGSIEVCEGDTIKAKVTGDIGYAPTDKFKDGQLVPTLTYFKFGHYRDYQPDPPADKGLDRLDVDRLTIDPAGAHCGTFPEGTTP